jgi:uncharacterized protein (DUF2267 family)
MIAAGLDLFGRTLHKPYEWLADRMGWLAVDDRQLANQSLCATLQALRDRMTVEEVAQLGAQLPMLVRGFYYEGWDPAATPLKLRHKEAFLASIASEFSNEDVDPEQAARAVFVLLAVRLPKGEIEDVTHIYRRNCESSGHERKSLP